MNKRTVNFTIHIVTDDASDIAGYRVAPAIPQYGGVKGEHKATVLKITLPSGLYSKGDVARLSFTTGDGTVLSSDILNVTASGTYIEYALPQLLTIAAGQLCVRVVISHIENGEETQTHRLPEMVLYFEEASVENGTPFWTGVSEMLHRTATASTVAVEAQEAAVDAQGKAENSAVEARDYANTAQTEREAAEVAGQEAENAAQDAQKAKEDAQTAAENAADDVKVVLQGYVTQAKNAQEAAVDAQDQAENAAQTAADNAGEAGNSAEAAQKAQEAAEYARDQAENYAEEANSHAKAAVTAQQNAVAAQEAAERAATSAWEAVDTPGRKGEDGKSAYEIAVANGFEGDEATWLESLKGKDGDAADSEQFTELKVRVDTAENSIQGNISSILSLGKNDAILAGRVDVNESDIADLKEKAGLDHLLYKGDTTGAILAVKTDQQVGDVWFVVGENDNRFYMWDGAAWTPLATGAQGATPADVIAAMNTEVWTFELEDGTTVEKAVPTV